MRTFLTTYKLEILIAIVPVSLIAYTAWIVPLWVDYLILIASLVLSGASAYILDNRETKPKLLHDSPKEEKDVVYPWTTYKQLNAR